MIEQNEQEIEIIDITPVVQRDTFVNDDYKGATINNIGRYLESKNKDEVQKRAKERLAQIK